MEELKGQVILIEKDEPAIACKWEKEYEEVNQGMQVIPYSFLDEYRKDYDLKIPLGQNIVPGTMMVKHPYLEKTYVDIVNFEKSMIEYKLNCMTTISKHLGAKKVEKKISLTNSCKRDFDGNGEFGYKWVEVDAEIQKQQKDEYSSTYNNIDTVDGEMTEESYNEAKLLAEKSGLIKDPDIEDLLTFAKPGSPIKNKTKHISINITSESNNSKEIAFSIKAITLFKLSGNVKESICQKKNLSLELDITF